MRPTEIPKGFKTFLPEEAEKRERILKIMEEVLSLWGYRLLSPPTIEYLSTFKIVDENLEEFSFKLVDRFTGKLMAIRPDFTPQVAKIVASSFKDDDPPFRFFYKGKIFRDAGKDREIFQFGFEVIGVSEVEADAEVVSVVVNILEKLGLSSFQIDIGNSEFLEGALEELKIPDREEFLKLLSHKDLSGIEIFLEERKISKDTRIKIEKLLELYGREEVLDSAYQLFENSKSRAALKRLKEMFAILKSYGFEKKVIFDLSEKRGMEYHKGITFEVFHPLYGFSLGSGGRYDGLMKKFGRNLPATGVALNVDALQELLEKKGLLKVEDSGDFYIIDLEKELHRAYELAKALRKLGYKVARDIVKRDLKSSLEIAFKKGFKNVIVLNRENDEHKCTLFLSNKKTYQYAYVPKAEEIVKAAALEKI
ncbi:ATP phosphoribosyltransferase regulatory subunit [Desulfurobacterium thermolithotrophum DSM 11699]|uniref:ATP phosphoribosyltransferase regulatory subunit n=1 Tax=Desulfurobacterium thermolithotrophum (strain DSM 11699 / BSA) TaxID=868864 RepID=F0S0F3_DESTD|nr:ATP phosphoribosyltransferase regulatory subunit [Desulfurobacterium thermolithotrophum]ADY72681.1 ATP phosphoribosyltransferase regulatory subunit [Desulfurobacterium thermolithotrophum DSM 11699]